MKHGKFFYKSPYNLWGQAVDYVRIDDDGRMWIGNGEYETQVNFCPFTGTEAPNKLIVEHIDNQFGFSKVYRNEVEK